MKHFKAIHKESGEAIEFDLEEILRANSSAIQLELEENGLSMENKVVSYELCKQLDEHGFKCESHTGWYREFWDWDYMSGLTHKTFNRAEWTDNTCVPPLRTGVYETVKIKAYDCWDLLEWLSNFGEKNQSLLYCNQELRLTLEINRVEDSKEFAVLGHLLRINENTIDLSNIKAEPQEALAQAVIEILKESE